MNFLDPAKPGDSAESPDDVLFAVDQDSDIAYPYDDEPQFSETEEIRLVASKFPDADDSVDFAPENPVNVPATPIVTGDAPAPYSEPPVAPSRPDPAQIPGRNRVSYSQGRPRTGSSSRFLGVETRERAPSAGFVPFGMLLTGIAGAMYFWLLAGSPVLAGVSFTAGATLAMFCRVLMRR